MTIEKRIQFERRYQTALHNHLRRQTGKQTSIRSAGALGRSAVSLKLDTLDLARMHERAVAARPFDAGDNGSPFARSGAFFFQQVMGPLVDTHPSVQTIILRAQRVDAKLRECSAALALARQQTQQEASRRKKCEQQLVQGARHYSQLLAQSRRLAHQILSAQEEERKKISRELHDEVAQVLAGINVRLAALQEAAALNSRGLRQRVVQTQRLVGQSIRIVHRYARELRPSMLDDLGLVPALRSYIKDMSESGGPGIQFTAFPGVETLSNIRRTVLYRVAQEALTNVVRHARARQVKVSIRKINGAVRLEIHDDGRSFKVDRIPGTRNNHHLGILGMRERVEMVGGDFAITSAPGKGTTVRAEIPFRGRRKEPVL